MAFERLPSRGLAFLVLLLGAALAASAAELPGRQPSGVTLLPNGWRIAPAGRHLAVGDLPLAMAESPDGRMLVVTNNGYEKPTLTVVDPRHLDVRQTVEVADAWLGLAWHPDGQRLYASGGAAGTVGEFRRTDLGLQAGASIKLRKPTAESFVGGLSISPDGSRLFAVEALGKLLSAVDLASGKVLKEVELPAEGYTTLVTPDGGTVLVSLWGGAKVLLFDAATLEPRGEIPVGEHPNAMALAKDGRLFVACANTNAVWVADLAARMAKEQISIALTPAAPPGSTPNGLSLSPDGRSLLVANADNNTVALVDVARPGASVVQGFIPTGWYPTAAQFSHDGKRIFVLSGKGLTSVANPQGNAAGDPRALHRRAAPGVALGPARAGRQGAGRLHPHGLSADAGPEPGGPVRSGGFAQGDQARLLRHPGEPHLRPDPGRSAAGERRSQPLPVRRGGDPERPRPRARVRPPRQFLRQRRGQLQRARLLDRGLLQRLRGEGLADELRQARRRLPERGGGERRNAYGNITAPKNGYLWDACNRAGVSVRSYGEFVDPDQQHPGKSMAMVPGLEGHIDVDYPGFDLAIPDNQRVDLWLREFHRFEATEGDTGGLPRLTILRLPADHTLGTRAEAPTPRAMIAENDLALGRVVEAITKSRFWKESAIFVVEDDAQNGPDHVDAHRSVVLVASPYTRRHAVDSTLYTTAGVLRTMELILGLRPMSQYDAAATPLVRTFQAAPDLAPFVHREARVPVDEKNGTLAWGAAASRAMNLDEADLAPELELNEILWKSVRGAASPMPPPVHSAFVRSVAGADDDDDD